MMTLQNVLRGSLLTILIVFGAAPAAAQAPSGPEQIGVELPSLDAPAARTTQASRDLAIVVAVQDYHNLSGVPGAVRMGMNWTVFFEEHLGLPEDRILFLKNNRVFPSRLERAIPKHLKKAHPKGRVWFVFIGHGAPYQAKEDGKQVSDGLLVGVNALNDTYDDFVAGSIRTSAVEKMLAQGKQRQTIMVLDACFSGKTPYNQNLTGTQAVVPTAVMHRLESKDVVFSAAQHNEVANLLPGVAVKRPAFSYTLLGALRGWADRDGDEAVTLAEAETYVERALLGLQTPSASVEDGDVRDAVLVERATEDDPGVRQTLQRIIQGEQAYANKSCDTDGKVRNADTQGHCCWPGQAWSSQRGACLGSPMCPDGMALGDDGECHEATGDEAYAAAQKDTDDGCGSPERCAQLGEDVYFGRNGPKDYERAAKLFRRACEGGHARGCYGLGVLYNRGEGVARDAERAATLFRRACEGGHALGCNNLGVLYAKGEGVARDAERAATLYRRACEGGRAVGCSHLGLSYAEGEGVARDAERAAKLYRRACEGGDARGCTNLGVLYAKGEGVARDAERAAKLYRRACEGGNAFGCTNLGTLYSKGEGVARDAERAAKAYRRGCEGGHAAGCTDLGFLYSKGQGVAHDAERAAKLYRRACEGGHAGGCTNLGYLYHKGEGVARDAERAAKLYWRGCEGGHAVGCSNLGALYHFGDGVARDAERAATLYRRGCEGGHAKACDLLKKLESE
jgi:TPR repeat protein